MADPKPTGGSGSGGGAPPTGSGRAPTAGDDADAARALAQQIVNVDPSLRLLLGGAAGDGEESALNDDQLGRAAKIAYELGRAARAAGVEERGVLGRAAQLNDGLLAALRDGDDQLILKETLEEMSRRGVQPIFPARPTPRGSSLPAEDRQRGESKASTREARAAAPSDGFATIRYPNGDVYEGEVDDGKPRGRGVCRYASGHVYDGEWKDNNPHGIGTQTFANGDVYEGQWSEGNPHRWGTLTWASGNVHEGEWKEGKLHGKGTLRDPTGRKTYEGHWVDGMRRQGIERLERGSIASEDVAIQIAAPDAPSSRANMGGIAPNTSHNEQSEKEKRIYFERQIRSQSSQQRRLEKCTASKQFCQHCCVDDCQYKLRVCSGCNLAHYCSAACQKAARGSHERICDIASQLPSPDGDMLVLKYDRDQLVDLDAGLRYATKYMHNLKHLQIDFLAMRGGDVAKLSAKRLSSLLKSKKGALDSVTWLTCGTIRVRSITQNGNDTVWRELHGLKRLSLFLVQFDDVQCLHDIIGQQKHSLIALCLQRVWINGSKAKNRRTIARAINSCKQLVSLDLTGCVLMDADLKTMLNDLPDLRVLCLKRDTANSHELTDNTCGLIARKCPGLQELNLFNHDHLSVRGIRKIFEGCVQLRSFCTSTRKLRCEEIRNLLDIAPQLMYLSLDGGLVAGEELDAIIESTGGRTVLQLRYGSPAFEPGNVSEKAREKYDHQTRVLIDIWDKKGDPKVEHEWASML